MTRTVFVDERGRRVRPPRAKAGSSSAMLGRAAGIALGLFLATQVVTGHHPLHRPAGAARVPAAIPAPGPAPGHQPWSVFTRGNGAAVTWAADLLTMAGLPRSDERFVYDWELSEGGGGKYNPLNQGPVPGRPQLTSTGQQYGGGAADYVSWQAGLAGSVAYLHMPDYAGVLGALRRSDYQGAAEALWSSQWAGSHYGHGSAWRTTALGQ